MKLKPGLQELYDIQTGNRCSLFSSSHSSHGTVVAIKVNHVFTTVALPELFSRCVDVYLSFLSPQSVAQLTTDYITKCFSRYEIKHGNAQIVQDSF